MRGQTVSLFSSLGNMRQHSSCQALDMVVQDDLSLGDFDWWAETFASTVKVAR